MSDDEDFEPTADEEEEDEDDDDNSEAIQMSDDADQVNKPVKKSPAVTNSKRKAKPAGFSPSKKSAHGASDLLDTVTRYCDMKTQHMNQPNVAASTFPLLKEVQLHGYQVEGANWILSRFNMTFGGCVLGDEMGLGKTMQAIAFVSQVTSLPAGPHLIICPLSVIPTWQAHFSRHLPACSLHSLVGSKAEREHAVSQLSSAVFRSKGSQLASHAVLTTYELLSAELQALQPVQWASLIVDEAHRLKNPDAVLYQNLLTLTTRFKLLLTGTPCQNHMAELWSLLHFIEPLVFADKVCLPCLAWSA